MSAPHDAPSGTDGFSVREDPVRPVATLARPLQMYLGMASAASTVLYPARPSRSPARPVRLLDLLQKPERPISRYVSMFMKPRMPYRYNGSYIRTLYGTVKGLKGPSPATPRFPERPVRFTPDML